MKVLFKYISFALLMMLMAAMPTSVQAETHYKPRISIGGRAGMSMGMMSFSPSVKQKWLSGTTGAVTFRYVEEKLFGLIAEVGWAQRGWAENFGDDTPCRYSRSLTYIQVPLLTHIYFGKPRFKCFINLGPEFAYLIGDHISANFDYHNPYASEGFPNTPRMTEQMSMEVKNRFDYGITGGVGFEFYITPRNSVTVEGRYYFGLGNVYPAAKADTFSASRNTGIEVSIGYNFRLR